LGKQISRREATRVTVTSLVIGDSPRLSGEIPEHVQALANVETLLPPLLVHRGTMRVIDGMHRLRAAMLRGDETILVEYFDGDEATAFVAAVKANVTHGMPLSLADRECAATRILTSQPNLSDRAVADIAGLAARTVAAIRTRIKPAGEQSTTRLGKDGRVRPLSTAEARRLAGDILTDRPESSLRDVARVTGLSPTTVRDVKERLRRGDEPVPARQGNALGSCDTPMVELGRPGRSMPAQARRRIAPAAPPARDSALLLGQLNRDPSLRLSESGRAMLRWLSARASGMAGWEEIITAIPPHSGYLIAELARDCATQWTDFANNLERRLGETA
jgi:hypothetical protein